MSHDVILIGAGIVGLATATQLQQRWPALKLLLLEKERGPAFHQSGRNSGVVHAGVYYEPGSLKARFCREGAAATYAYCRANGLPFRQVGKLVVATGEPEMARLRLLFDRCRLNGLEPVLLDRTELRELEPAVEGRAAILVAESGIVDYPRICDCLLAEFRARGGEVCFDCEVTALCEEERLIHVHTTGRAFAGRHLVACGGLMADRLALMQGLRIDFRIIPYRGEYYRLRTGLQDLVQHLVYPVPDPALPFLGVHFTPMIDGSITVGPNAVQSWKREGYGRLAFSLRDSASMLAFPGFWRTSIRHLRYGVRETWNSVCKRAYLAQLQRYCPSLRLADLEPHPAGIRAQAVLRDGTMLHDFLFEETPRSLHVCNAPSPAATSALPIARHICDRLAARIS
ncbi:MAG: L-2-hydroxyglutarate oxidase [Lysobacterales bacterium]|nr:MAG: L-2-hydroxyglutarate oxidase [Xanthomonadales bacterium]